ncbi:MAG: hypothetical protein ACRCZF_18420 [Gemmataceae bacterium]
MATLLQQQTRAWSSRTGGTVVPTTDAATADIRILNPAGLGALIRSTPLRTVPELLRQDDSPLRWSRIVTIYRERLTAWEGEVVGVPLAGEARVLITRADKLADPQHRSGFQSKFGRPLVPPTTYEEIADIAEYFASTGAASLPPTPAPERLLHEFHLLAACYDRPALTDTNIARKEPLTMRYAGDRALTFHHDLTTGLPRLTSPGFVQAASWLARVQKHRMSGTNLDPVAALGDGSAVLAILTLSEVARLPRTNDMIQPRFGVGALPGTRVYYDAETKAANPPFDRVKGINFVPYLGSNGLIGVVPQSAAQPETAFELLAELASPDKSLDRLADPTRGFGPFRTDQLESARDTLWQNYGFDTERSKEFANAVRMNLGISLANPVLVPRAPDQAPREEQLAKGVLRAATGALPPEQALAEVQQLWIEADKQNPQAALWRRLSAGLTR